ncbi:MAG TPA: ABC transporter permease [Candidatus Cryosericum sp.]|nr:ABC transporter permease [Candidatus Cryosericum sp.]
MDRLANFLAPFRRRRLESELDAELRFHLQAQIETHLRAGLTPEEARRMALCDLGGMEAVKEACRDERRGAFVATLWQDVRYAARLARRSPAFTLSALATLAIGLGAGTTLFCLTDAALLKPLPYPDPSRLVRIWDTNREQSIPRIGVTTGNVADWRRSNRTLSHLAAWYVMGRTLRTDDDAVVVLTAMVSADFFPLFATPAALGRTFTPEETDRALFNSAAAPIGADPVVVISDRLWRNRFQGDADILGRSLSLERQPFRVVGVMPGHFEMPAENVDLWIPWSLVGDQPRDQHYANGAARLKPGISLEEAQGDLDAVAAVLEQEHPQTNRGWRAALVPLQEEIAGGARPVLVVLLAGVGLLLLVGCANLAGLQLVRVAARRREDSLRRALGASRARLVRQHLTESGLLTLAGGAIGLLLADLALGAVRIWGAESIPRLSEAALDARAAGFAALGATLAWLALGAAPALAGASAGPAVLMRESARATAGPGTRRWRAVFSSGQVAVAFVLLVGAGLLARSYLRLASVDPGFAPDRVLVLPIFLDTRQYNSGAKTRGYYGELERRLAALPGVEAVGGATALPTSPLGPDFERPVWDDAKTRETANVRQADVRVATTGYFDTLGIAVTRGRGFTAQDAPDSPRVVMINESLARQVWQGRDPVGRLLRIDYSTAGTYAYEVVGVVGDVRFRGLRSDPRPEIYLPHALAPYLVMNFAVRTKGEPEALIPAVRQALRDVDPLQPAHSITPLRDLVGATVKRDRFAMNVVLAFAVTALILAVVGLYGVLSYSVRQRTREIGVRLAIGAQRRHVFSAILTEGARIVLPGMALGFAAALVLARSLGGLLYGVGSRDPSTLGAVAILLAITALVATVLAARRAALIDPIVALRHE